MLRDGLPAIGDGIRTFGLYFGGLSLFVGGGVATIYGLLLFYVASPGSPATGAVTAPLNRVTLGIVTHELFVPVAAAVPRRPSHSRLRRPAGERGRHAAADDEADRPLLELGVRGVLHG